MFVVDRRHFIATALGLSAAAISNLPAAAATMTYDETVNASRTPLQAVPRDRELVRFATLAANSHNTQPWIFSARGNEITIAPDFTRRCPAVDPDDHHLFVSLGCAAENLILAASALGWRASPVVDGDRIVIALEPAPAGSIGAGRRDSPQAMHPCGLRRQAGCPRDSAPARERLPRAERRCDPDD